MKNIDSKSLLIGILSTALVAVIIGAGPQQPAAAHRYQISAANGSILALDNQTGIVTILNSERRGDVPTWIADSQFSLKDAIEAINGAPTKAGPSHRP